MMDYQKELADSLDKSDQIDKLEAKVEELQRQLAEREAWVEKARGVLEMLVRYTLSCEGMINASPAAQVTNAQNLLITPTDHTALDEAIKQAKVEVLEKAAKWFENRGFEETKDFEIVGLAEVELRRMADEIGRK